MNYNIKELIRTLAKKHNISIAQAEEIYIKEFELVKEVLSKGNIEDGVDSYRNIGLPKLGKFVFKESRWEKINNK